MQEFFATSKFGSEVNFNRTDVTNSTYYAFGRHKYVLARNTRLGFETFVWGEPERGQRIMQFEFPTGGATGYR